jgi:hypothetical protein
VKIRDALEGIQRLDTETARLISYVEENLIYRAKDEVHRTRTWAMQEGYSVQ